MYIKGIIIHIFMVLTCILIFKQETLKKEPTRGKIAKINCLWKFLVLQYNGKNWTLTYKDQKWGCTDLTSGMSCSIYIRSNMSNMGHKALWSQLCVTLGNRQMKGWTDRWIDPEALLCDELCWLIRIEKPRMKLCPSGCNLSKTFLLQRC